MNTSNTYSIRQAAKLSGLPESTLRYYESIGLIKPVNRNSSSKHRTYSDIDLDTIIAISCLSATGLSLDGMRTYLDNEDLGKAGVTGQLELLEAQEVRLAAEAQFLETRREYVALKIKYWRAVATEDTAQAERVKQEACDLAGQLKPSKKKQN